MRTDQRQTVLGFAFRPLKPKRGWHFVCMRRRKVYGRVETVRPDRSFKWTGSFGVVIDSRKTGATWETVQLDKSGEFRFLEVVPADFDSGGSEVASRRSSDSRSRCT